MREVIGHLKFPYISLVRTSTPAAKSTVTADAVRLASCGGDNKGQIFAKARPAATHRRCDVRRRQTLAYLKATLTAIAKGHRQSCLDNLLLSSFTL